MEKQRKNISLFICIIYESSKTQAAIFRVWDLIVGPGHKQHPCKASYTGILLNDKLPPALPGEPQKEFHGYFFIVTLVQLLFLLMAATSLQDTIVTWGPLEEPQITMEDQVSNTPTVCQKQEPI